MRLDLRYLMRVLRRSPAAYPFAAVAPLRDGDVLIAGGYSDGNQNTASVWRFGRR